MDLQVYRIDWPWVLAQKAAGIFGETFFEEREKARSKKIAPLDELSCLDGWFFRIAEIYARSAPKLSPDTRKATDSFFLSLFVENRMCQDLSDDVLFRGDRDRGGFFQHSISPESVVRLLNLGETLDFAALEAAYERGVDDRIKGELAEMFEVELEAAFQQGFVPFVQSWIGALRKAARHHQGMLSYFD